MQRHLSKILVLIGLIIYNILFWQEKLGANVLLFTLFLITSLLLIYKEAINKRTVQFTALGTIITAIAVVFFNSSTSKVVYMLSLLSFAGFVQAKNIRFIGYAFLLSIQGIIQTPLKLLNEFSFSLGQHWNKQLWRFVRLVFLPFIVVLLFYAIYVAANQRFANLSASFWNTVSDFLFEWIWTISLERLVFILLGLSILAGLLWKTKSLFFEEIEKVHKDTLKRVRTQHLNPTLFSMIGLKNEYKRGLFLLVSLNILLFLVNLTDISYVWFEFEGQTPPDLRSYVHEGTYLLIFAILLGMGVLLYFFRKNLNFYPKNKLLRYTSYIWIVQNAILAFSVGIRNYHYIAYHGLAYKRIGVIIFLLLVFFGLFTMYQKIVNKQSLYALVKNNAWALYIVLIGISCVNWDTFITNYNIHADTKSNIDAPFLINNVSDKNLPLLYQHQHKLSNKASYPHFTPETITSEIRQKRYKFLRKQSNFSWASWNYPDHKTYQYLKENNLLLELDN